MAYSPSTSYGQQDLDNFADMEKDFYAAKAIDIQKRETLLINLLERTKKNWKGKQHVVPVILRSTQAMGARGLSGNIPSPSAAGADQAVITNRRNYCAVQVDGLADAQTQGDKAAWANVKAHQIEQTFADFSWDLGRQAYGDGKGILCECSSYNSGTVTIKTSSFTNNTGWAWTTTKCLRPNMKVAWGTYSGGTYFAAATPAAIGYGRITAVSRTAPFTTFTITKTSGTDPAAGDVFVLGEGTAEADNAFNKEEVGLRGIVDDADDDFQGINTDDYPEWASIVDENSGVKRAADEALLERVHNRVDFTTNGKIDLSITHPNVRTAFVHGIKALGRETYQARKIKAGWESISYAVGGSPMEIVADRQCQENTWWGLDRSKIKLFYTSLFHWDTSNGGVWKWVSRKDAYEGWGKRYANWGCTDRRPHFRIDDIATEANALFE